MNAPPGNEIILLHNQLPEQVILKRVIVGFGVNPSTVTTETVLEKFILETLPRMFQDVSEVRPINLIMFDLKLLSEGDDLTPGL